MLINSVTSAHIHNELARSSASHCATCSRHALTEMCRVRTGRLVNQLVKPSAGAVKPVGGANSCEGPSQLTAQPTAAAVPQGIELVGARSPSSRRRCCRTRENSRPWVSKS